MRKKDPLRHHRLHNNLHRGCCLASCQELWCPLIEPPYPLQSGQKGGIGTGISFSFIEESLSQLSSLALSGTYSWPRRNPACSRSCLQEDLPLPSFLPPCPFPLSEWGLCPGTNSPKGNRKGKYSAFPGTRATVTLEKWTNKLPKWLSFFFCRSGT